MKNLLEQIQSRLDELNKAERKVAEVILQNPQQATRFSIAALAQAAAVKRTDGEPLLSLLRHERLSGTEDPAGPEPG
ncbi:hypothetical protein P4200_33560 [Pseudomonas aeruginosa]|nr:hypothetical protein [Pseudomonas aeruginosa]